MFPTSSAVVDETVSRLLEHVLWLKRCQQNFENEQESIDAVVSDLLMCKFYAAFQRELAFFYPNIVVSKSSNGRGFDENCKLPDYEDSILNRYKRDLKKLEKGEITTLYIHCRDFMVYFTTS